MGIPGLFTYIKDHEAYKKVDIVNEAREKKVEIIIDFQAISRFIIKTCFIKLSHDYRNKFLMLPTGEYDIIKNLYFEFHMAFMQAGISLVWVNDGPKGVDEACADFKDIVWRKRDHECVVSRNGVLDSCSQQKRLSRLHNLKPVINPELAFEQLRKANAEVIHVLQGEADDYIAHLYKERQSYAIFTNDTDFIMFKDCNVVFEQMFSLCYQNSDFNLPFIDNKNRGKFFVRPTSFWCAISNSDQLIQKLNLDSYEQLLAVCIVNGNDFTTHSRDIIEKWIGQITKNDVTGKLEKLANYVKTNKIDINNIFDNPEMKEYLLEHPNKHESINFSRRFYLLEHASSNIEHSLSVFNSSHNGDNLTNFLSTKLSLGQICTACFAIHHGFYFQPVCNEDITEPCLSVMDLLLDIRQRVYPYLLNQSRTKVCEWNSKISEFVDVPVKPSVIQANKIKGIPEGMKLFEDIWSHNEPGKLDYVKTFGMSKAFILYLLRYMWTRNGEDNLFLSLNEFKALFVTVFFHFHRFQGNTFRTVITRESFLTMNVCPSPRCLTIATWFMYFFFNGKYICGGALNVTKYFPPPLAVMSGSVMYAVYEVIMDDASRVGHLHDGVRDKLYALQEEVTTLYSAEYGAITSI